MRGWREILIQGGILFSLAFIPHTWGDTHTVADYGTAFEMFQDFGLTAADPHGQYGTLSIQEQSTQALQPIANTYQMPFVGKGWIWSASENQPARYLFLGGIGGERRLKGKPDQPPPPESDEAGDTQPVLPDENLPVVTLMRGHSDLQKDVSQLFRLINPATEDDSSADGMTDEWGFGEAFDENSYLIRQIGQGDTGGALLLVAAHLYQAGLTNEANELTARLFTLAEDPSAVVRNAVAQLAKSQYMVASWQLGIDGDWKAYRQQLQNLLDRFELAWELAPGLEILIQQVDQRLAGDPPEGEGLDEAASAFFANLSSADAQLLGYLKTSVILNPAIQLGLLTAADSTPSDAFCARGIHMIPQLLAVIDSGYLLSQAVEMPDQYGYHHSYSHSYSSMSGDHKLKSAEDLYKELENKPPCLGDTAQTLLKLLCPAAWQADGEIDKSNTATRARAFYDAHSEDSPVELAAAYLAAGTPDQCSSVVDVLIQSQDTQAITLVESYLFSTNIWALNSYSLMNSYVVNQLPVFVKKHPDRVAVILPNFLKGMRKEIPDRVKALDESRQKQEYKQVKELMTTLKETLQTARGEKKEEEKTVEEPKKKEEESAAEQHRRQVNEIQTSIELKSKNMPPSIAAGVYLDEILSQPDAGLRQALLCSMLRLSQYSWAQDNASGHSRLNPFEQAQTLEKLFDDELFMDPDYTKTVTARANEMNGELLARGPANGGGDTNDTTQTDGETASVLTYADQWEQLLADDRVPERLEPTHLGMGNASSLTVADTAAWALSTMELKPQDMDQQQQMEIYMLGKRLYPYYHTLARELLDGGPLEDMPSLPSSVNLTPEAVSNLIKRVTSTPLKARGELFRAMDPSSLLALGEAAKRNAELREALTPLANQISGIGERSATEFDSWLEPFVGETLSTNLCIELIHVATSLTTQSVSAAIIIQRNAWLDGTTISIYTNDFYMRPSRRSGADAKRAFVRVGLQGIRIREAADWKVQLSASDAHAAAAGPSDEMQQFMSQFGVSIEDSEMSPEMLAQMAEAMAESGSSWGSSGSSEEDQTKLLKTVAAFSSGAKSPLTQLLLQFYCNPPQTGKEDEDSEMNEEWGFEEDLI